MYTFAIRYDDTIGNERRVLTLRMAGSLKDDNVWSALRWVASSFGEPLEEMAGCALRRMAGVREGSQEPDVLRITRRIYCCAATQVSAEIKSSVYCAGGISTCKKKHVCLTRERRPSPLHWYPFRLHRRASESPYFHQNRLMARATATRSKRGSTSCSGSSRRHRRHRDRCES